MEEGGVIRALVLVAVVDLLAAFSARAADPPAGTASPPASSIPEKGTERFQSAITVGLASVYVRVLDPTGAPIPNLKPEDLRVRIGGKTVPIVGVDSYDGSVSPDDAPDDRVKLPPGADRLHTPHRVSARGQLFVFFVETARDGREAPLASTDPLRSLAEGLKAGDWAAVVSLDSRLKLQLDFTRDRPALYAAILRGLQGADPPSTAVPGGSARLSLARSWDERAAGRAGTTERALSQTAVALEPLPGEKVVIYLSRGGAGRFALQPGKHARPTPSAELYGAIHGFHLVGAALFVLEEPRPLASLAGPFLRFFADSTGGTYAQLPPSRDKAVDRLLRETRAYSIVTFKMDQLGKSSQLEGLEVALVGKPGTILASPLRVVNLGK